MTSSSAVRGDADLVLRHGRGGNGESRILVGAGALERARDELVSWHRGRRLFIVHPAGFSSVQPDRLEELIDASDDPILLEVPDGETAKTIASAERLWTAMLEAGGTRDSRLIAIGGGSAGDLGGFVAASFLRGIGFALVPTTLLAQVDAAIGGKTAIDLPGAKNSVGAFWHPHLVIADTGALASLDAAEWRSGLVEVIKIAMAIEPDLFEWLESEIETLSPRAAGEADPRVDRLVRDAIATKCRVVESDPGEADARRVLNLGHTLGHAIEAATGYRGLRHGEAVAYGLMFALRLAVERGGDPGDAARALALIESLELPRLPPLDRRTLLDAMRRDKKARVDGLRWILPMAIGRVEIVSLATETIEGALDEFLADHTG